MVSYSRGAIECHSLRERFKHDLVLPVGKSGGVGLLSVFDVFLCIAGCICMACMPHVPAQLLGQTLLPLPASTDELRVFVVFRRVLMVCIVSAAGRVHAVAKVSLCPFDASDRLPRSSVATTSRYVRLRACNTTVAHISSFAGVNSAESAILPLEPSALPCDVLAYSCRQGISRCCQPRGSF